MGALRRAKYLCAESSFEVWKHGLWHVEYVGDTEIELSACVSIGDMGLRELTLEPALIELGCLKSMKRF